MKHNSTIISLTAASFFALAASANATDLFGSADNHPAPPKIAFEGLAIGVHGGGQFTSIDVAGVFDGISADGLVGGAHAEYLFSAGRFRIGPYVEGGWSNVNTELTGLGDLLHQEYYYGGGLKAGFTVYNSSLIYARGGYEWAVWQTDIPGVGDIDFESFVIGGGVETMVSENVSIGLGADYLIPNDVSVAGTNVTSFVEDSEQLRVLGRLTWRQ